MPQEYVFDNFVIYDIDKQQNFLESTKACQNLGSKLLSLKTLTNNTVYSKIRMSGTKQRIGNKFLEYRMEAVNNDTANCFSVFNRFAHKVNLRRILNICRGDYEFNQSYYTFCEKNLIENTSENESSNSVLIAVIVAIIVVGIFGLLLFVFRQKIFSRFHNVLVEDDADRNSNNVSF